MNHATKQVRIGDRVAEIDIGIAELVKQIWIANIDTTNSCEENEPGIAWLQFPASWDAIEFLNIVGGDYCDDIKSLYNRIRREWQVGDDTTGEWNYEVDPWDISVDQREVGGEIEEKSEGDRDFLLAVSMRFPTSDIPELVRRLEKFNERREEGSHSERACHLEE